MYRIREMLEADQSAVETLAVSTGMFAVGDWQGPELNNLQEDHHWIVALSEDNEVIGGAYFAPEQVSDRLWNTFFLSVSQEFQGKGVGRFIMTYIEELAREKGIRTLIVETSSLEGYSQARSFYQALGYVKEAEIRDYYGQGDNKIVFWKSLA
jgi:ribosomal protein S18 acetylase RimI-like enzyme